MDPTAHVKLTKNNQYKNRFTISNGGIKQGKSWRRKKARSSPNPMHTQIQSMTESIESTFCVCVCVFRKTSNFSSRVMRSAACMLIKFCRPHANFYNIISNSTWKISRYCRIFFFGSTWNSPTLNLNFHWCSRAVGPDQHVLQQTSLKTWLLHKVFSQTTFPQSFLPCFLSFDRHCFSPASGTAWSSVKLKGAYRVF